MKFVLALAAACLSVATASAQAPDVLHYTFDTGDAANMASPGVGEGTVAPGLGFGEGACGPRAAEVMAIGGHVDTGWQMDIGTGAWTVGCWIDLRGGGDSFQYLFGSPSAGGFRCFVGGIIGSGGILLRTNGGADIDLFHGAAYQPFHVAWTYDPVTQAIWGYVNGQPSLAAVQLQPVDLTATAADFKVLAYGGTGMLVGNRIDDFRFYGRALSPAEIAEWAECAPGTVGSTFCGSTPNSTGRTAVLEAAGSEAAADDDLTLLALGMPAQQPGLFLASRAQGSSPLGDGTLCLGGAIGRFTGPGEIRTSSAAGSFALTIDVAGVPQGGALVPILAGETWHFQAWFRDPEAGGAGSNLTDAVAIAFL